jgi:hypothetical protein
LIITIVNSVAAYSWDEVGGPGAIIPFAPSGSLVIHQTFEAHEEIALLLSKLRQSRDVQHITPAASHNRRGPSRLRRESESAETPAPPPYHIVPPPTGGMGSGLGGGMF